MNPPGSDPQPTAPVSGNFPPPVSTFNGPIAELVGHGLLAPPNRPGLLASLDRFEVLKVLGGGGMGVVLLARDTVSNEEVAVKMVRPELAGDAQITRRFVREAGHLQKLRHPNIVPVREISDRAAGPYFVMPYFAAGSLARRIEPGKPLPAEAILELASRLCAGLQFAHQRGIIHRDLKPANVLCTADGQVCLADFGLARTLFNDSILTVDAAQCEGTAPYMSPGVAAGNAEDTRCDIYAFGALLYELLTLEPPYHGRTTKEIRDLILAGPPPPILTRNPAADPRLARIAAGAMGRELRERYADMADIQADLQRVRAGRDPLGPHGTAQGTAPAAPGGEKAGANWGYLAVTGFCLVAAAVAAARWPRNPAAEGQRDAKPGSVLVKAPPATHPPAPAVVPVPVPTPTPTNPAAATGAPTAAVVPPGPRGDGGPVASRPAPPVGGSNAAPPAVVVAAATNPPPVAPAVTPPAAVNWATTGEPRGFPLPWAVAVDPAGAVYVTDKEDGTLTRLLPGGGAQLLAGTAGLRGATNGLVGNPRLALPRGIAVDTNGTIYVAEAFHLSRLTPNGGLTTLAGLDGYPGGTDGTGAAARFSLPSGVAVDRQGNIYVADRYTIRKVSRSGVVTTLAGDTNRSGRVDSTGTEARFSDKEKWMAVDAAENVYVADTFNNVIRKLSPFGVVTTLAGKLDAGAADGTGEAAQFNHPGGLAVDRAGNVFVADTLNHTIRRITAGGRVATYAGVAGASGAADGPAGEARFNQPQGVAVDAAGRVWVADAGNQRIRWISPEREVFTLRRPGVGH